MEIPIRRALDRLTADQEAFEKACAELREGIEALSLERVEQFLLELETPTLADYMVDPTRPLEGLPDITTALDGVPGLEIKLDGIPFADVTAAED